MGDAAHTFVFADLAGYSAATEAHGDERAADLVAAFYARVRELLADCEGQEVKQLGDALMLRLDDAATAVRLATRVAAESGVAHGELGVRVGMHTGPAVERYGDWFGASVNLAARVAAHASSGEVLITEATREAAEPALADRVVQDRGAQRFRNIAERVRLFAILVDADRAAGGLPLDPVCRMTVDPVRSSEIVVHRGIEYRFCSAGCRSAFEARPGQYVARQHRDAHVLVSERARLEVAAQLGRAYETGRLAEDELEERIDRALGARTRADLRDVTTDLPRSDRHRRRRRFRRLRWIGPRRARRRTLLPPGAPEG